MATTTKKKFSAEDKKAYADSKREEQRAMLAQAVEALCSSDGWKRYLNTRAKFWNYSFSNTILIALQKPEATQVAGAGKWNKDFDRRVKAEEFRTNSIKILAPMFIYAKDDSGKLIRDDDGNKVIDRVWYKTVEVYDISQTEGEPVPSIPLEPITGESHEEYLYRAEQYATGELGYTVDYEALPQERGGFCDLGAKRIVVNASRAVNGQVRTIIHEIAHALGIDYTDYTREEAEVIVESAAYLTCLNVGLDTGGMTVPYIAQWGSKGDDPQGALKTLKNFAKVIDELTFKITEAIS
jgi:hypothetical protein